MQAIVTGAAFQPTQRCRQIVAERDNVKVVRSQQLMGEAVVDRQIVRAATHQWAMTSYLVVEGHRVLGNRRICDQPRLQLATPNPELREPANHSVHREPVQPVLQHSALILKSVVTTLLGLSLLIPEALPVMV